MSNVLPYTATEDLTCFSYSFTLNQIKTFPGLGQLGEKLNAFFKLSSKSYVYIPSGFDRIGSYSWVSFYELFTIVSWNFGPFLPTELVELGRVLYPCSTTNLFSSAQKCSCGMRCYLFLLFCHV
ncbi:hypothetical protein GOODEAATRI_007331 [Goodea atripinnis]|uniref:Uncharacterized protein n=1 Tax=Goodea atripinnis TaxID=208336 RepID=A0ABV0MZI0_9TELE